MRKIISIAYNPKEHKEVTEKAKKSGITQVRKGRKEVNLSGFIKSKSLE